LLHPVAIIWPACASIALVSFAYGFITASPKSTSQLCRSIDTNHRSNDFALREFKIQGAQDNYLNKSKQVKLCNWLSGYAEARTVLAAKTAAHADESATPNVKAAAVTLRAPKGRYFPATGTVVQTVFVTNFF